MAITSRKQRRSTGDSKHVPPMPWVLTGIVSVGLVGLSGFWIVVILRNYAIAEDISVDDLFLGIAGLVLAATHIALHAAAVFLRQKWAASTVIFLLALETLVLTIACFDPAIILVGLAIFTFTLCGAMCHWRYKAFNYPSLFILLDLFEGRSR